MMKYSHISGHENRSIPIPRGKGGEATREQEKPDADQCEPRRVRSPPVRPGEFAPADALRVEGLQHADVVEADAAPVDQDRARRQAQEPVEDGHGGVGHRHVGQRGERQLDQDCDVGDAVAAGLEEDPGGLVLEGQGVQGSGSRQDGLVG